MPVLRNVRPALETRTIASSPAKSERLDHSLGTCGMALRRLSQDSGIVAGRLYNGIVRTKHKKKTLDIIEINVGVFICSLSFLEL